MSLTGGKKLAGAIKHMSSKVKSGGTVTVGFLEGATYPDGTSVPMVAAIQEYGAPSVGIPPRPFFRQVISEKGKGWGNALEKLLLANDFDAEKSLGQAGQGIKGQIQKSIRDVTGPPLSPVTLLLRKRFWSNPQDITLADVVKAKIDIASGVKPGVSGTQAKPLVWTGHLLNSVDYEVKMKG